MYGGYDWRFLFLNQYHRPVLPGSTNEHIWKPALRKVGLEDRRLYETRHTFATLMLDGGELPGWVHKMMGHETLQMIHDRYYSYIKNYQRDDGRAFMENVYHASNAQESERADKRIDWDVTQERLEITRGLLNNGVLVILLMCLIFLSVMVSRVYYSHTKGLDATVISRRYLEWT